MRFSRPRRPGRALLALAIVALISVIVRGVWSNGLFSSVDPQAYGQCRVAATLPGVSDMETANGQLFIAVSSARGPDAADGIYALASDGKAPVKLAGTAKDFHPRGIGLLRTPDGKGLFLYAVNKRASGRFSIDSFEVTNPATSPALVAQGTIEGGLLINPQDVAATAPGSFYVANGTASKNPVIHWFQTYGILSGGNVLYFNGMMFREVAGSLYGTRSIVAAGDHIIVGGLLSRSLTSFTRDPYTGALTEAGTMTLPAGPEKITRDNEGALWVAGHANLLEWRAMSAESSLKAPSQVLRVSMLDGVPQETRQVYGNEGAQIAGASVAVPFGKRLMIGSTLDNHLLDCAP